MNYHVYKGRSKKDILNLKKDQKEGVVSGARSYNYIINVETFTLSNILKK